MPLSALAKQLLAEISVFLNAENYPLVNGENKSLASDPYVFPSSKGRTGHVAGFEKAWAAILKAAKIEGLRVHDLRHSYASLLASSGERCR